MEKKSYMETVFGRKKETKTKNSGDHNIRHHGNVRNVGMEIYVEKEERRKVSTLGK